MLGKRPAPVIGKLTNSFISGNRPGLVEVATSPRSPLDFKIQSPRGLKNYDLGGVGLGIVAALEKSPDVGYEIQANKALYNRNLNRSNPIPVNSAKNSCSTNRRDGGGFGELETDSLEEYTLVTCRRPGNKSYTKVYYAGGEHSRRGHESSEFDWRSSKNNRPSVFAISPARFGESTALPASDFLSSCHWCQKKLDGKDIYMYRGEKAFCSTECRYRQIVMDEHKEKCSSEVSRSAEVSSSPYKNGPIFSLGILAI